jgi:L-2-hydroxyglutarate oxidase
MIRDYDVVIIGAGIVGLATAYQLSKKNQHLRILMLEKESDVARHQTGHNSGVLHSGIYYKPGSLKAKNCVDGYRMMVEFCRKYDISHEICGKIIVATNPEELSPLHVLYERAAANGLSGVRKISTEEIREREPHVHGVEGLFVPQTGIVDFGAVSVKMKLLLEASGVVFKFNEEVKGIKKQHNALRIVQTTGGEYTTRLTVSCAGLQSDRVARMTHDELPLRIIPFRGEYYAIKKEKRYLVNHLIYPVPDPAFPFLGVHFTRMINGEVEAGPNAVFAFKREGYTRSSIDAKDLWESLTWPGFHTIVKKYWRTGVAEYYRSFSKAAFAKALQKLIPEIHEDDLEPGGAGVRAQACSKDGELLDDFNILENGTVIHVCNAPSPAATSSLSIGNYLSQSIMQHLN